MQIQLPSAAPNAHIAILGGSFNPPHLGHVLLATCVQALQKIDAVWIIPCASHPHDKKLIAFEHRLAMCKISFRHFSFVQVIDIEARLPTPNYTIQTVQKIKKIRPDVHLSLVLGSDLSQQIESWHLFKTLIQLCSITIFKRQGFPNFPAIKNARIYDSFALPHINSSALRKQLKTKTPSNGLDQKVIEYIHQNKLYA